MRGDKSRYGISDDELVVYHSVWRSLLRGTTSSFRAPLPLELVQMITHHAGLAVVDRKLTATATTPVKVCCLHDGPYVVSRTWFWTEPLDSSSLNAIAHVRRVTESCNQGWATRDVRPVFRTWFDVGIFPPPPPTTDAEHVRDDPALDAFWGGLLQDHDEPVSWATRRNISQDKTRNVGISATVTFPPQTICLLFERGLLRGVRIIARCAGGVRGCGSWMCAISSVEQPCDERKVGNLEIF